MRIVAHRTGHVVVVGAGLTGLAGHRLYTGPTVLTMPGVIEQTFGAVASLGERLVLTRLDPAYRACFADGSTLDVRTGREEMTEAVRAFAGSREAAGYARLCDWATRFAEAGSTPGLTLEPAAPGGFRRWDRAVGRFLRDERLRRVFGFPAPYAAIACVDTVGGVWFPRGGMRALPDAAADAGVEFRYGTAASALERHGRRVIAVHTADGGRIACEAVVLTCEPTTARRLLGHPPRRALASEPPAVVTHLSVAGTPDGAAHHTLLFDDAWRTTFRAPRLMGDPPLLVTRPTDPSLAPAGRRLLTILAPAPAPGLNRIGPAYAEELAAHVTSRCGVPGTVETLAVLTSADRRHVGTSAGPASASARSGPFRTTDNVVLAGHGVAIPTALMSGRLAADRVTGTPVPRPRRAPVFAGRR